MKAERDRGGFSLLEVMLGSLIFSVVFAALGLSWKMEQRALKQFRDRNVARTLAEMEIERCKSSGFRGLDDYVTQANLAPELSLIRTVDGVPSQKVYKRLVNMTEDPEGDIKSVVVKVSYDDANDVERSVVLETALFYTQR